MTKNKPANNQIPTAHKLDNDQVCALIDILRRNFLYQDPHLAVPADTPNADPEFLILKMKPDHWRGLMWLISHAGGWSLPPDEMQRIQIAKDIREARDRAHKKIFGRGE